MFIDKEKFGFLSNASIQTEEIRNLVILHALKSFDEVKKTFVEYKQSFRRFH